MRSDSLKPANYTGPPLIFSLLQTFNVTPGSWQHVSDTFSYCKSDSSNLLSIHFGASGNLLTYLDNISLREDTSNASVTLTSTLSKTTSNCHTRYIANINTNCVDSIKWTRKYLPSGTTTVIATITNTIPDTFTVPSDSAAVYTDTIYTSCSGKFSNFDTLTFGPLHAFSNLDILYSDQSAILTAKNAVSATWSPVYSPTVPYGVVCSNCLLTSAVPRDSSLVTNEIDTYKVVGIDTSGCLDSAIVSVTVFPKLDTFCTDTVVFQGENYYVIGAGSINSSTFASGRNFYVIGNLNIGSGLRDTLDNKVIMLAQGVSILIHQGASMVLSRCHLFTCPVSEYFWQGITLSDSGSLYLNNNTLIEDADTAVSIDSVVKPASGYTYVFVSDKATFNRNAAGIQICKDTIPPMILIRNTVITSRYFMGYNDNILYSYPRSWPPTTDANGLKTPYIPSDNYLDSFNIDNPKALFGTYPYSPLSCKPGGQAQYGILLNRIGKTHGNVFTDIQIGDNTASLNNLNQNLFDNLNYGIYGINSNLSSVNNAFVKCGDGIYATGNLFPCIVPPSAMMNYFAGRLRVWDSGGVNHNRFYDCLTAVEANTMVEVLGEKAFMLSSHTTADLSKGVNGYNLYSWNWNKVDINNDTIVNITNAVALHTFSLVLNGILPLTNIHHNEIRATLTGVPYNTSQHPNRYVKIGVELESVGVLPIPPVVPNLPTPVTYTGPVIGYSAVGTAHIDSNRIMDVSNGIYANGLLVEKVSSNENNIVLAKDTFQAMQFGIWHASCIEDTIYENENVHGLNILGNGSITDSVRAYLVSLSGPYMSCNWEDSVGRGFEFAGTCSGTQWYSSHMNTNLEGLYLNYSLIDTQRLASNPISDAWEGSNWSFSKLNTFVLGSPAATASPLFVAGTSSSPDSSYPMYNLSNLPGSDYTSAGLYGSTPGTVLACTRLPHSNYLSPFNNIATRTIDYGSNNSAISAWMSQYKLWQILLADTMLVDSSVILQTFQDMGANSRFAYLTQIEDYIANGYLDSAHAMANTCPTPNPQYDPITGVVIADSSGASHVVNNYRKYYKILIHYLEDSITVAEKDTLTAIAYRCPMTEGAVVYNARALYGVVFNTVTIFSDDICNPGGEGRPGKHNSTGNAYLPSIENISLAVQQYFLSPNPNNGRFILRQKVPDPNLVNVEIWNAEGKCILKQILTFSNGMSQMNVKSMIPGLYIMHLQDSQGNSFIVKFVVDQ